MVEQVLAKDWIRVRFPAPALIREKNLTACDKTNR